jgi:hypothetical protein
VSNLIDEPVVALVADRQVGDPESAIGPGVAAWVMDEKDRADSFQSSNGVSAGTVRLQKANIVILARKKYERAVQAALADLGSS